VAKKEGGVAKKWKTVAKSANLLAKKKMYHLPRPDTGLGPVLGRGLCYIQIWPTVTRLISVTTVTLLISYVSRLSASHSDSQCSV
jgi:hypothetical protein